MTESFHEEKEQTDEMPTWAGNEQRNRAVHPCSTVEEAGAGPSRSFSFSLTLSCCCSPLRLPVDAIRLPGR